jgi:hypothetical protein
VSVDIYVTQITASESRQSAAFKHRPGWSACRSIGERLRPIDIMSAGLRRNRLWGERIGGLSR